MTMRTTKKGPNRADFQTDAKTKATGATLFEFGASIAGKGVKEGYVVRRAQGVENGVFGGRRLWGGSLGKRFLVKL